MDKQRKEKIKEWLFETGVNAVSVLICVLVIRTFLISPFQVHGHSMDDTLSNGDYIIVDKLSYRIGEPQRGDIVIFHPPSNLKEYYIKRIIGLPGDTVKIANGDVFVNGKKINEWFLNYLNADRTYVPGGDGIYNVPEDHLFVLGDNRNGSNDSRHWVDSSGKPIPFVSEEEVQGRLWMVLYPFSQIQTFARGGILLGN